MVITTETELQKFSYFSISLLLQNIIMNRTTRVIIVTLFSALLLFSLWYFSGLVVNIIISLILSLIGRPLVHKISKIKIRNWQVPTALSAAITLILQLIVVISIILVFIPIVSSQANVISNIDNKKVSHNLQRTIENLNTKLVHYGLIDKNEPLEVLIDKKVTQVLNVATFSNMLKKLASFTGSFFTSVFSILFMTFFFLKEENLFQNTILLITPQKNNHKIKHILMKTKILLSRYFIGLMIEIASMISMLIIGLSILGVPSAILIGFFGGTMNVIPYLGPLIGAAIGMVIGALGELGAGNYIDFYLVGGKVGIVFLAANLVDNVILQPLIYSNSVKAHPLEIFIVIMMAGSMGGAIGMILAIPTYTILRIIVGEFLGEFKLVQQLTSKI